MLKFDVNSMTCNAGTRGSHPSSNSWSPTLDNWHRLSNIAFKTECWVLATQSHVIPLFLHYKSSNSHQTSTSRYVSFNFLILNLTASLSQYFSSLVVMATPQTEAKTCLPKISTTKVN